MTEEIGSDSTPAVSQESAQDALKQLSQAYQWLETLVEAIDDGLVTINSRGQITSVNRAAEKILSWQRDVIYELQIDDLIEIFGGEHPFSTQLPPVGGQKEITITNRSGGTSDLFIRCAELRLPQRKTTQTALIMRDITEEVATRNLRSHFLSNISHEFRTPIAALNASVELMLDEIDNLEVTEIAQLLSSIHLSVTNMQTLIDNLLESASMEAGYFKIRPRPINIVHVLHEALRIMKPLLDRRSQAVVFDEPAELPSLRADPTRLTQVLVNLISNASKYSPMGEHIGIELGIQTDSIRVAIADRGRGLSRIESENLFRRFTRIDDQEEPQYGIGLGLAVVKAIVEEHQGSVGVMQRPEGGSEFWFKIPLDGGV